MMVLIDTNILVYGNDSRSPFHERATRKLNYLYDAGTVLCISNQTVREYLAVVSRIAITEGRYDPDIIRKDVQIFEKQYYLLEESVDTRRVLLQLLDQFVVGGKQVHDANLVATALFYGVPSILTHNVADFKRFDTLIEIIPLPDQ